MGTEKKKLAQVEAETQDEIQQIMSDIEGMQAEIADKAKVPPAKLRAVQSAPVEEEEPVEAELGMADFRGSGDEPSMEETLAGMKEEETSGTSLLDGPTEEAVEEVVDEAPAVEETVMKKNDTGSDGTLTMTLTGSMTLKLNYECDGQAVMVGFEDGALKVELADGTEFKVPVARTRKIRAA